MTTKACVAVALAVWMTWAAFLALPANALPNHVVAGGVLGPVPPGTQTGPTNPANEATFAFYSTNAPAYAVLSGADVFTAADGTNPAFYFKDVGASWNWAPGDTVVVVTETVRGTNGWANVNYTSSARGTMQANPTTTDVGDATLEQIPPLTLTAGAGSVNVQWTALTDPTPNLASYHLYSATSPGGPYTTLVTVAHAGGAQSYLNSGLTSGTHCYELAVQYHRDTGATTYETTGRSEFACATVIAPPPTVVSTNPTDGATNVAVNAPVVITFDEAINTVTFAYNFSPSAGVTVTAWSGGNTIVTITHPTDFSVCTTYTVTITTAQNSDGTNIVNPYVFRFTTACTNPVIQSTSPVQGATSVPRTTNVIVTFSKAMNTGSVTVAINTAGGSASTLTCTWNPTNTIATCAATLGNHVQYFVNVSGTDTTGNALVPGAVPGCCGTPFWFWSNQPPTAAKGNSPALNACYTGGTDVLITWTMSDLETAATNLRVWLNWTDVTTSPIAGPLTGLPSSASYTWTTPAPPSADKTNAVVDIAVFDAASEFGVAMSDNFRLDYTRPTGSLTRPTGTTNVPTDTTIEITFSEAMDTASTWTAVSITPTVPGLSPVWTSGNSVLTIGHGALNANTQYTVTVTTGAKDACNPGLTMASSYQRQFTTGSGLNAPQAPRNVRVTSNTSSGATVQWDAPLFWQDGTPLIESDITTYTVYRSSTASCAGATSAGPSLTKAFTDSGLTAGTTYYYCVTATASGHEGAFGGPAEALTSAPPPPESFNWLLVAIPLIVIVLLIVAFLLLRRKKPAAAPPKGGAAARTSPREEPAEEEPEASPASARQDTGDEGREKFIPCPNCGTMVKPTDAECFVCGAKL